MNEENKNGGLMPDEETETAVSETVDEIPEVISEEQNEEKELQSVTDEACNEENNCEEKEINSYSEQQAETESAAATENAYTGYSQNTYYSQPQNQNYNSGNYSYNNQSYTPYQPVYAKPQPPKSNKGLKIFAITVCILLAFSIGVCAFVISRYAVKPNNGKVETTQQHEVIGNNGPDIEIGQTPDSSDEIPLTGKLTGSQVYAKASKSNVGIVVYKKGTTSSAGEGTGVIMGEDKAGEYTYIVTCAHVINDAGISVSVQTTDGTTYDGSIVGYDTRTDLGVVKIKASGLPAAEFGDSKKLRVGDVVYAIGNPGGVEFFGSFTSGSVSAIDRPVSSEIGYTMTCIQHDAAINPGNSGGMLINEYGQVIGINSQKIAAANYEGMGFAIPISDAMPIINNLIDYGYVPNRPKLGITYYSLSASAQYSMIAQINGLPAGTLIIDEIDDQSSLAGTQVQQYDMIIAVNGNKLTSADILLELIDDGKVGDKLTLTIARINRDYSVSTFDVDVTLVEDKSTPAEETTEEYYYVDPFGQNGYDFFFGY